LRQRSRQDEPGDDGAVQDREDQPARRLPADRRADPGVHRAVLGAACIGRDARRTVDRLDPGSGRAGSVLYPAAGDGGDDVHPGQAEPDAAGPDAGEDDDDHAARLLGHVLLLPGWPGAVLAGEQRLLDRAAVVHHDTDRESDRGGEGAGLIPIAAIATAPGRGGIGVVRVSGRDLSQIVAAVLGRTLAPRHATYGPFLAADGGAIDQGIAIHFPAPQSYTGEDVLELQGHGGPVVLQLLLRRVLEAGRELGLRLAEPGEFTQRAFLNDKLDLAQAEAVADLIDASTEQAARSATRSLSGEFSAAVHGLVERLIELRTLVEATLDFPEEEIDFLEASDARGRLARIRDDLHALLANARR